MMRRSEREVKGFSELTAIMKKCAVCRVAFCDAEYPYILPFNFGMAIEDDQITLYFHGALSGKKYELMAVNNKVGFEMDRTYRLVTDEKTGACTMEYESVVGCGTIEMVTGEEKVKGLRILMGQYHKEGFPINERMVSHTQVFKLTVNGMSGKRNITRTY